MSKFFAGCLVGVFVMFLIIMALGGSAINEQARAVKAGVGRYIIVNPENGETKFEYIKP